MTSDDYEYFRYKGYMYKKLKKVSMEMLILIIESRNLTTSSQIIDVIIEMERGLEEYEKEWGAGRVIDNIFIVRIDEVIGIDTINEIKDSIYKTLKEKGYKIFDKVFIINDFKRLE